MKLNELKPVPGARHSKKRVGRGSSSGHGDTSGREIKVKMLVVVAVFVQVLKVVKPPLFKRLPKRVY